MDVSNCESEEEEQTYVSDQDGVHYAAQSPTVHGVCVRTAVQDLRRNVTRCSECRPFGIEVLGIAFVERDGKPKVANDGMAILIEKYVVLLQVAVYDAKLVVKETKTVDLKAASVSIEKECQMQGP